MARVKILAVLTVDVSDENKNLCGSCDFCIEGCCVLSDEEFEDYGDYFVRTEQCRFGEQKYQLISKREI